jgi:hypothetical protein
VWWWRAAGGGGLVVAAVMSMEVQRQRAMAADRWAHGDGFAFFIRFHKSLSRAR